MNSALPGAGAFQLPGRRNFSTHDNTRAVVRQGRPVLLALAKAGDSEEFAGNAKKKISAFVKRMAPKVENSLDELKRTARRTYQRLDSEYELTANSERAGKKLKEAAIDVDQTYGLRRRLRRAVEWFDKSAPVWNRNFKEFTSTQLGKVVVVGGFFLLLTTPLFWRVVNWLVFLWWLALPIATFLTVQKAQKAALDQAASVQAERERQQDPLGSMFKDAANSMKNAGARSKGGGGGTRRNEGPIVDAEWKPVDDQ